MDINIEQLTAFLGEANKAGYASAGGPAWKKEPDGSTTITYQRDDWLFHDNYFGGEPYGGREVIFYQGRPVLMMVYYGRISDRSFDKEAIYSFLREALRSFSADAPFRGPEMLEITADGRKMRYENDWQGTIEHFGGEERIFIDGTEVYDAKYAGGLVDQ